MATMNDLHADVGECLDKIMRIAKHYNLSSVIPTLILRHPQNLEGHVVMSAECGDGLHKVIEVLQLYADRKPTTNGTTLEAALGLADKREANHG